jgi:predicted DsbA family dithiol-disulfide isomerase
VALRLEVKVEIWSDVVCPWCYVGKRRFEAALARFDHRNEVEVVWRSFELDPRAPRSREGDLADRLAKKYGMTRDQALAANARLTDVGAGEGLAFHFASARPGNTFDAHRLLHLAGDRGLQDALKERFLAAYFSEGEGIGEPATLVRLAGEVGLDASEAQAVLDGDKYGEAVRLDEQEAADIGISGVPFFVVDRTFAVSGAQSVDVLLGALDRAWVKAQPGDSAGPADEPDCEGGSCAV